MDTSQRLDANNSGRCGGGSVAKPSRSHAATSHSRFLCSAYLDTPLDPGHANISAIIQQRCENSLGHFDGKPEPCLDQALALRKNRVLALPALSLLILRQ